MREPLLKRPFDVIFSVLGLLCSSWLWALVSVAIIIEDGFPVLIRQRRIGKNGQLFDYFKFRSMRKHTLRDMVNQQAIARDPRTTFIGRFLRKSALDELPQLLNIFVGQMSFVGPRPLLPFESEIFSNGGSLDIRQIPGYEKRITVRPGLTGLAQIYAERNLQRKHKFKFDLLYIRNINLILDMQLILLSFIVSFHCTWESHSDKLAMLSRYGAIRAARF
jgi:lipopolysaccharide/colanic/teichoic acid biosynthesis glycosyltransferase